MVEDIDPHIIGMTKPWANKDISDAELGLTRYIMLWSLLSTGENILNIDLSSQNELLDNVKIHEPMGNNDHNKVNFGIKVKSESKSKNKQE